MTERYKEIILELKEKRDTSDDNLLFLLENVNALTTLNELTAVADFVRRQYYGNKVYIRGLIEISNICNNNCFYCGIRNQNTNAKRYYMTQDDILKSVELGIKSGIKTVVLQGGENNIYTDEFMVSLIKKIKDMSSDIAVTLSLGERSYESYKTLKEAGADRYLLRHEAISPVLYSKIHPTKMSIDNRVECINNLIKLGYQTGVGFMVGVPFQTDENLVEDLRFIQKIKPQMIGIGPFIAQKDTPFGKAENGSLEKTLMLLAILRLMNPKALIPATTALATISSEGQMRGIKAGCNVIMPNLSPIDLRENYSLYDNKKSSATEAIEGIKELGELLMKNGYHLDLGRGDAL